MTRTQSHACLRVRTGPHGTTRKHVYRRQSLAMLSPYSDSDSIPRENNTTDQEGGWTLRSKYNNNSTHHHHHFTKQYQRVQPQFVRVDHHHDYDAHDIAGARISPWNMSVVLDAGDMSSNNTLGFFDSGAETTATVSAAALAKAQSLGYIPLPPAVCRVNLAGSPLSPYTRQEDSCETQGRYIVGGAISSSPCERPGRYNNNYGYRTMSSGGPGSGGGSGPGGETASPGGGDDDSDQPGSYTFRRRNAVVEGTDEAPRPEDFEEANTPK